MKALFFLIILSYNCSWKVSVKMKKIFMILMICLIVFCTACGNKLKTYTVISYDEYLEKVDNDETFPLVIGSAECSACGMYEGTMEIFIEKYQVEVFFIDISKLSTEERVNLNTQINYDGTPTTVFIEEGNLTSYYNRIDGAVSLSSVENYFKINNYID